MRLSKRFFKSAAGQATVARLGWLYARLVFLTARVETEMASETRAILSEEKPYIAAFWHGRLYIMCHAIKRRPPHHILISSHSDGRLISRLVALFGAGTVTGSSSSGGSQGLRGLVRCLRSGVVAVTPDGPRGPRMRAKAGTIKAAQLSGRPIVPIGASATRVRILGSWDRFMVPLPFCRIVALWDEPMQIPRHASEAELDGLVSRLEERINDLTEEADRRCAQAGRVLPAEPEAA